MELSSDSEEYNSDASNSGSDQISCESSGESSGKDWSDLEEQARKEDKARDFEDEEDRRDIVTKQKRPNHLSAGISLNKKRKINFSH